MIPSEDPRDIRMAELLAEALSQLRAGQPVDTASFQARYADLANELPALMGAMIDLDDAAGSWKGVPSPEETRAYTIGLAGAADRQATVGGPSFTRPDHALPQPPAKRLFSPDQTVPEMIGRYQILERIGAGGMGRVYKAYDPQLQRLVALKLPRLEGPEEYQTISRQRFLREARAAALIRHARVCPIHDVGEHQGMLYVVMAYVEGQFRCHRPG
jgi:Protein kinase domain